MELKVYRAEWGYWKCLEGILELIQFDILGETRTIKPAVLEPRLLQLEFETIDSMDLALIINWENY